MHPDLDTPTAGNPPCVVCPDTRRRPSVDDKSQACARLPQRHAPRPHRLAGTWSPSCPPLSRPVPAGLA
jgi:hypothetical protein